MTSIRRANRALYLTGAFLAVLILVVINYLVLEHDLTTRVDCINSTLKHRQSTIDSDHRAEVVKVQQQKTAETLRTKAVGEIVGATSDKQVRHGLLDYQQAQREFTASLDHYLRTIQQVDAAAQAYPLGRC